MICRDSFLRRQLGGKSTEKNIFFVGQTIALQEIEAINAIPPPLITLWSRRENRTSGRGGGRHLPFLVNQSGETLDQSYGIELCWAVHFERRFFLLYFLDDGFSALLSGYAGWNGLSWCSGKQNVSFFGFSINVIGIFS